MTFMADIEGAEAQSVHASGIQADRDGKLSGKAWEESPGLMGRKILTRLAHFPES